MNSSMSEMPKMLSINFIVILFIWYNLLFLLFFKDANIDGQSMFVQYARRSGSNVVKFRPQGLKLGRRRDNGNNGSKNFHNNNNRRN